MTENTTTEIRNVAFVGHAAPARHSSQKPWRTMLEQSQPKGASKKGLQLQILMTWKKSTSIH